jgi:hypothetical protein
MADTPTPVLERGKNVIALCAALVATSSLVVSFFALQIARGREFAQSGPNVQLVEVEGHHGLRLGPGADSLRTSSGYFDLRVTLRNFGRVPAQIVAGSFEPLVQADMRVRDAWLVVTQDLVSTSTELRRQELRGNPLLDLRQPTLAPGTSKTLRLLVFFPQILGLRPSTPSVRIALSLSNGAELVILPDKMSGGVTSTF